MYRFEDTPRRDYAGDLFIPTSAMYYNGLLLEEEIPGYQTLTVEGREMYSFSFDTQDKKIGSEITQVKFPSRQLTIKFKLEDNNAESLQTKFDTLLSFLYAEEDVPIKFNDDIGYLFYGRFMSSDTVPGNSNSVISSFTIYCSDPFKYSKTLTSGGIILEQLKYPVRPDKFIAKMTAAGTLHITDGDFHLRISSTKFNKGDTVEFDFNNGFIYVNGIYRSNLLDLDSDFKNVRLFYKSNFTGNNYSLSILYRKKVL